MTQRDTRSLSIKEQELLRQRLITLVEQHRMTVTGAAEVLGVNRKTATVWLRRYRTKRGRERFSQERRGRRRGDSRRLTAEQERAVQKVICGRVPTEVGLSSYALWTRDAVAALIAKRYGINLPVRTMGLYLNRWGFSPQRPLRRAYERDQRAIARWRAIEFPKIAQMARKCGAEIHFEDETGVTSEDMRGRGYSPRGVKPIRRHFGKRSSVSMASTITRTGVLRFMVFEGALTAAIFLVFLKRLISSTNRPVFLVLDNIRPHHARIVTEWVKQNSDRIRLFFLPAYAPELNPDECLNNLLKGRLRSKSAVDSRETLARRVRATARSIQRSPELVKSLFRETNVSYAALTEVYLTAGVVTVSGV